MIHLRPVRETIDKIKQETTQRLRNEIAEQQWDTKLPRHFKEREIYRQQGGN